MRQYLDLLSDALRNGFPVETRAVLPSTGRKVRALSVFGRQARFDLSAGFPLVTVKRTSFHAIASELAWFLSGSTNANDLRKHGVRIWDAWADADGGLGPIYGKQWRSWAGFNGPIDQISRVVADVKAVAADPFHPARRRLIVSAWNPADLGGMALPPCHVLFQFNVCDGRLSCHLYQRSADLFLGVPYNIASYALLTHLVASAAGLGVGEFIHSFADLHVYENHVAEAWALFDREPRPLPRLKLHADATLDRFGPSMAALVGYDPHPASRAEVAV